MTDLHMRWVGCTIPEGESFPLWLKCVGCGHIEHRQEKHQRHCRACEEERRRRREVRGDE